MDFLEAAAKLPGIYVPMLYDVAYNEDGTIASFTPNKEGIPATIDQGAGYGHERCSVSGEAGSSLFKGYPGPCGSGDPARLHPWLPFLPGRQHCTVRSGNAAWSI